MRQSCLVRHIYTRTILNLPAVDTGKQTVRSAYIYTRTKPNRLLIMKIGIVAIALTLFHNHALVHKELVKRHKDIASMLCNLYLRNLVSMPRYHIGASLACNLLAKTVLQCFPVLLFRQLCKRKVPVLFGLLEIHNRPTSASVVIDAKCNGSNSRSRICIAHRFAYIAVLRAFRDLQDGFSLLFSSVPICPLVLSSHLFKMQYGMDMQIIPT